MPRLLFECQMIPHGGLKSTKRSAKQREENQGAEQSAQIRQYVSSFFIEHLCRNNNASGLSD